MTAPDRKQAREAWRSAATALTIPTMMGACPLAGYLLGMWFDSAAGTRPWGGIVGVFLGLAAGVRETILLVRKISKLNP